jgi:hypothetical protein
MNTDTDFRNRLASLLDSGHAHVTFDEAVAGFPARLRGTRAASLPYSAWELLEHMRIAQWDILEFSRSADHVSPPWPEGYWPKRPEPPEPDAWERSIRQFREDRHAVQTLIRDPAQDLATPFPHGTGQDLLREALLIADHNAYHIGQLVLVRRALGAWER